MVLILPLLSSPDTLCPVHKLGHPFANDVTAIIRSREMLVTLLQWSDSIVNIVAIIGLCVLSRAKAVFCPLIIFSSTSLWVRWWTYLETTHWTLESKMCSGYLEIMASWPVPNYTNTHDLVHFYDLITLHVCLKHFFPLVKQDLALLWKKWPNQSSLSYQTPHSNCDTQASSQC